VNTVLDKSTIFVAESGTNGFVKLGYSVDEGREVLGVTNVDLAVGETKTFDYKVRVNDDVKDGVIISNRATCG
ncbi:hypothetical protein RFZ45_18730, partial [Acinetobacter baumannii]|nr:hypothetical protein [Acinetobacter baumannii]